MRKWIFFTAIMAAALSRSLAADDLDAQIRALNAKYGAESVRRAMERVTPDGMVKADDDTAETKKADVIAEESKKSVSEGLSGFLIRRSYSDVTADQDPSVGQAVDSYKAARPAEISYSHDFLADSNEWTVHAAVIRPINLQNDEAITGQMSLTKVVLAPSVTFDRVTNSQDAKKEVDSLGFRLGLFAQFAGGPLGLELLETRAYATYGTNSDFHGGVIAGEFDIEPTTGIPGNDVYHRIGPRIAGGKKRAGSLIEAKWRAYFHNEFGEGVGDPIGNTTGETFWRLGPVIELSLDPLFLQRLNANVHYAYLADVAGHPRTSHDFTAGLHWTLDRDPETQHWMLSATFEDGDGTLTQENVRLFVLSLSTKY
jgi:hypothetical protein